MVVGGGALRAHVTLLFAMLAHARPHKCADYHAKTDTATEAVNVWLCW